MPGHPKKANKEKTKFQEFNFHRPESLTRKNTSVPGLLKKFLAKSLVWIHKKATIRRKALNHLIFTIYSDIRSKMIRGEEFDSLLIETYDTFITKYGLKSIGDKKFLEFIASLIKSFEYRRSRVFLRFIEAGEKINTKNFSRHSFIFYLSALSFMQNSKIGLSVNTDDSNDKLMFPTIRATECVKELCEGIIDKNTISLLVSEVEKASENDPKNLNPAGAVELEFVLEMMTENYEKYQNSIIEGIYYVFSALNYDETSVLSKSEFLMLIRSISPEKMSVDDNKISFTFQKVFEGQKSINIEGMSHFTFKDVINISIEKNILSITDISDFCKLFEHQKIIHEIGTHQKDLVDILEEMKYKLDKKWDLDEKTIENKFKVIEFYIKNEEKNELILIWKILSNELRRIKREFLN